MFYKNNNKKVKRMTALAVMLALIVPALVTASVVISYTYTVSSSNATPDIYLVQGENYQTAYDLGLFTASTPSTGPTGYVPAETIDVNSVSGSTNVYLMNVLEVYNSTVSSFKGTVNIYITSNLNSNIVLYYSTTPLTFSSGSISGNYLSSGSTSSAIPVTTTGDVLYIGFAITTQNSNIGSPGSFTIQYDVS